MGIAVELHSVEHRHDTDILHVAIAHDGVEDDLSMRIYILQFAPRYLLQESRNGKDAARREPSAHVVSPDVVEHRVVGNLENTVLQFFERSHSGHLLVGLGIAEDEVAESHMLFHESAQIEAHLLRVFIHEPKALCLGLRAILCLGTL